MVTCERKVHMILDEYDLRAKDLAEALHVTPALISKWKSGDRKVDKRSRMPLHIAEFFLDNIETTEKLDLLGRENLLRRVVKWLYDGSDTSPFPLRDDGGDGVDLPDDPPRGAGFAYYGVSGIYEALRLMSRRLPDKSTPITVYISSEYSMLLSDPSVAGIWEYLYTISGQPVRVVFEQWKDAGVIHKITQHLMPFLQSAKMELSYIMSSERYLCYNISFYAQDICMVMTTEAAGSAHSSVSLFLDDKSFVQPMGKVLGKLYDGATPMVECWQSSKNKGADESGYYEELYDAYGDLDMLQHGVSLLYGSVDAYKDLMAKAGLPRDMVRFRVDKFKKTKADYEQLLSRCRCREIIRLDAFDSAIETGRLNTTDLYFTGQSRFVAGKDILADILSGMVAALQRYDKLQVLLDRDAKSPAPSAWRIKEDRCFLLHSAEQEEMSSIYSNNWLLCNQYLDTYDERFRRARNAVRGRENVISALQMRLNKLGRT